MQEYADSEEAVTEEAIRSGLFGDDLSVLETVWEVYASDLFGYLAALLGSRHDAEDALQDVLVTLAVKRRQVARARRIRPYLFKLARNAAWNRIKREGGFRRRNRLAADWLAPENAAGATDESEERCRRVTRALAELPEKQRVVMTLKFFRDKTLREIGEMLGLSGNTVASCLRYGMEKLRKRLLEDSL